MSPDAWSGLHDALTEHARTHAREQSPPTAQGVVLRGTPLTVELPDDTVVTEGDEDVVIAPGLLEHRPAADDVVHVHQDEHGDYLLSTVPKGLAKKADVDALDGRLDALEAVTAAPKARYQVANTGAVAFGAGSRVPWSGTDLTWGPIDPAGLFSRVVDGGVVDGALRCNVPGRYRIDATILTHHNVTLRSDAGLSVNGVSQDSSLVNVPTVPGYYSHHILSKTMDLAAGDLVTVTGDGNQLHGDPHWSRIELVLEQARVIVPPTPVLGAGGLIPVVVALPPAPADGQEVYYRFVPSTTPASTIPIIWHLKFDLASGKWEVLGSPPAIRVEGQSGTSWIGIGGEGTASTSYAALATVVSAAAPLAGSYEMECSAVASVALANNLAGAFMLGGGDAAPTWQNGDAAIVPSVAGGGGSIFGRRTRSLTAGQTVSLTHATSNGASTSYFYDRGLWLRPVRIG